MRVGCIVCQRVRARPSCFYIVQHVPCMLCDWWPLPACLVLAVASYGWPSTRVGSGGSFGDDLFEIGLTLLSQCRRDDASAKTPIKIRRLLGSFHLIITSKRVCKVTHSHQRWV